MRLLFVVLTVLLLPHASSAEAAHPFHATMAELDWNSESSCFEVALCMPAAVVEDELSRLHGKRISLDRSADAESLLQEYISSRVGITTATRNWSLEWVGAELEETNVWTYFELCPQQQDIAAVTAGIAAGTELRHTSITCRLLENRPGQVNLMTLSASQRNTLLHFSGTQIRASLDFSSATTTTAAPILTD